MLAQVTGYEPGLADGDRYEIRVEKGHIPFGAWIEVRVLNEQVKEPDDF